MRRSCSARICSAISSRASSSGTTPAGDDFIAGWQLAARLSGREGVTIGDAELGRTTAAGRALLLGARSGVDALERAGVRAVILKEKSPSCGIAKTRIGSRRRESALGSGVFAAMLAESPWFLIPETAFDSALTWWDWRRRLHAWLWLGDREIASNGDLTSAWHVVKFILQETQRAEADAIGRALAALPKRAPCETLEALRARMQGALRVPTTRQRATAALWKTYTHYRTRGQLEGVDLHDLTVNSPEVLRNVTTIAAELTGLERVGFENDLLFGTSPVVFRDARRVKARDEARSEGG